MAFALLIVGIILIVSSINNTQAQLVILLANDFRGKGNFVYWIAALLIIGAIGYIQKLKPVSDGLLVLIVLVLLLSRGNPNFNSAGGFFKQLTSALGVTGSNFGVNVNIGGAGSSGAGVTCPPGLICNTSGGVIGSVPPGGAAPPPIPQGPF